MDGDECEQTFKAETSIGDNFEFGAEADTDPSTTNRKRGSTSGNSYKFPLRRTGLFSGKKKVAESTREESTNIRKALQ